jgi:hypothetical protein
MLLGRGVDVPMFVIVVGAIGNFVSSGIIGLFLAALGSRLQASSRPAEAGREAFFKLIVPE